MRSITAFNLFPAPRWRSGSRIRCTHSPTWRALAKFTELKKGGIYPRVPVQHGPTTSLYYRDPDGNMVELQIDDMAPDEATAYLKGDEYSRDPFRPSFDPEAMLTALRAGTPESELITRTWASTCPQQNAPLLLLT